MLRQTAFVLMTRRFHSFRRLLRHLIQRLLFVVLFVWDTLNVLSIYSHQSAASVHAAPPPRNTKRIYIACQHWNTEKILRSHWNNALLALVKEFGPEKVFMAIYESGSYDNTKGALKELDAALGELNVKRKITLSNISHKDEITKQPADHGWIRTPSGRIELRCILFLADLRNQVLLPLELLLARPAIDTVLFLNDVVFSPEDVLKLLDTNNGEYAAACSLDFSNPHSHGHEAVMQTWPYFRSQASRHAVYFSKPVPVASCWNGMVAMPVEPFLRDNALRFRGISDSLAGSQLVGSECCRIHSDNPLSATKGVYLNANVRVGYNSTAYQAVHSDNARLSPWQIYEAIWQNRILRWTVTPKFKEWIVHNRARNWRRNGLNHEPGEFCLVNQMQIIMESGWKHVWQTEFVRTYTNVARK
ncbi:glycosyltransferase family 69 protein [Zopfia rhizophila CBS 207.26]|uniref:Glycosyltransferase family 69 protein n=1 Tax=Zopfia rhizophila CBS 207.26 TaxID=1314779 RepID=A0A6A6EPQ7_9PEZI|nr:glycosyltransferase family 69 protein [Zopfia rhizophila CBS 207.26]